MKNKRINATLHDASTLVALGNIFAQCFAGQPTVVVVHENTFRAVSRVINERLRAEEYV